MFLNNDKRKQWVLTAKHWKKTQHPPMRGCRFLDGNDLYIHRWNVFSALVYLIKNGKEKPMFIIPFLIIKKKFNNTRIIHSGKYTSKCTLSANTLTKRKRWQTCISFSVTLTLKESTPTRPYFCNTFFFAEFNTNVDAYCRLLKTNQKILYYTSITKFFSTRNKLVVV